MSLFDETVARAAKAEARVDELERELAAEKKHSKALERALTNSRALNTQAIRRTFLEPPTPSATEGRTEPRRRRDLNSLTKAEEEQLFNMRDNEPWINPDATPEPERPTLRARLRGVASLLTRRA